MNIRRFEDIEAWQLARELCKLVKRLTSKDNFSKDWTIKNQIHASSGSVMDSIAEGFGRGQNNEFKYFLGVAKGSCEETRSQGYRASDYEYISQDELYDLLNLSNRTSSAIQKFIEYLNKTDIKGIRNFKHETQLPTPLQRGKINFDPFFPTEPPPNLF